MYGFNYVFWLNWITPCTSFSINAWFSACFKAFYMNNIAFFVMKVANKLITSCNFFLWGKNIKSLWRLNKFFGYSTSTLRKYPLWLFMKSSLNWDRSSTHLKLLIGGFWDISHSYRLLASNYMRYDDVVFLS